MPSASAGSRMTRVVGDVHAFSDAARKRVCALRATPELRRLDPPRGPNRLSHRRSADLAGDADPRRLDREPSADRLQRQLADEARPPLECRHRGTGVVEPVDNLVQWERGIEAVRRRAAALKGAEGVEDSRLMLGTAAEALRQYRVRVFTAPPGPPRALHHEGDERVPAVYVVRRLFGVSRRDDGPVLIVQVAVAAQVIDVAPHPVERQGGHGDEPVELRHHLGLAQYRQRREIGLGERRQVVAGQAFAPEWRMLRGMHEELAKTPFAFRGETLCVPTQPAHPLDVLVL